MPFGLVRTLVFISCMSKRRYFRIENQRSKGFNFYTTTSINWDMERATTIFYKRLTAILNEKRDSHRGRICFHLSFALLKKPLLCISGARSFAIMPRNAALHEPVDF